jgi:hypothetical protein
MQQGAGGYLSENVPELTALTDEELAGEHNCGFWDTVLVYWTVASLRNIA